MSISRIFYYPLVIHGDNLSTEYSVDLSDVIAKEGILPRGASNVTTSFSAAPVTNISIQNNIVTLVLGNAFAGIQNCTLTLYFEG